MSTFTPPSIETLQEKFPTYRIESFIAQGGMGAVYLARQISLDRPVAIKILPMEFGDDENYRTSFETEAKAMARLNHSNLVGIYDFGDLDGLLYIVMEYVPGRSLHDTAHGQKVDQLEAARLIVDMSDGLAHAHSAGMLHRDIKPANVLIDDEVRPKIVDFGLARPMGDDHSGGVVFGTPGYTAPEVLNNPYSVDQRSDIFSMGVMLYELLTGMLPGDPFVPASQVSQSDYRFDAIVAKAIHPDPSQRYASADDLKSDLEKLINNFGNQAQAAAGFITGVSRPSAMAARPVRVAKSSGSSVFLILILLVGFVTGGIFLYKNNQEKQAQRAAVEQLAYENKLAEEKRLAEEQRQREIKIQREKELAEQKKRDQEKARLEAMAEREADRQRELREAERREAEALSSLEELKRQQEMLEKAAEAPKVVESTFDNEKFISELRENYGEKLAEHNAKILEEKKPHLNRLERALKRSIRKRVKGRASDAYMDLVEDFIADAMKDGELPDDLGGNRRRLGNMVKKDIDSYEEDIAEIQEEDAKGIEKLRESYGKDLLEQAKKLDKLGDTVAEELINEEAESIRNNQSFLEMFESE